jgi:hypothetical protein
MKQINDGKLTIKLAPVETHHGCPGQAPGTTNNNTVIPGRREAANPESINTDRDYGFRARPFGPSRNDEWASLRSTHLARYFLTSFVIVISTGSVLGPMLSRVKDTM